MPALCGIVLAFFCQLTIFSQAQFSTSADQSTMIVDDAPEMEVLSFGKTVVVKKQAKGVFAWGGDVIVEGRVEGDVAAIGGSVIQREGAFIGGEVIVFGGTYRPADAAPLRAEGKETVVFGIFQDELREMAQDPAHILSPSFSLAFLAQRILSVLFWFVVSLALTTLAPGAVSRAIARFQLSTLKVIAIGFFAFLGTTIVVIGSFSVLPDYVSVVLGLMAFFLLALAYVFGRVALQVSVGKMLQKYLFAESSRSETLAILLGVLVWTLLLSLPYVWTFAILALFSAGIGLVLTARSPRGWQKA